MELLDAYYHGTQYAFLPRAWHEDVDAQGQPIPFRKRRPSTVLPLAKTIVDTFVRALWGAGRRPTATLTPDKDDGLIERIVAEARLYRAMSEATRRALSLGSGLVVWRIHDGRFHAEAWDAKHATPVFKPGDYPVVESLDYRFKFTREVDGREVEFWHRETIDEKQWTIYEDARVTHGEPQWRVAKSEQHNLGFAPAVWFAIGERDNGFDGTGVFESHLGLIDEANYTASQMGRALYYNLDPQTVLTGVMEADIESLVKGGQNTWVLPADAKANLLESNGSYINQAQTRLELLRKTIYDSVGICLPDPEKISGAQSGTSLELLAAPQAARVDALREDIGDAYVRLLEQILTALRSPALAPDKATITVVESVPPEGRVVLTWGSHFPLTPKDALVASEAVAKASSVGGLSRASGAKYLGRFFGVEDVEADQKLVEADEDRQDKRLQEMDARSAFNAGMDEFGPPNGED